MPINGIGMNEMPPSYGGATKTTKAGTDSFSESTNYIAYMEAVMKDMKMLGQWDSYLAYDKWLNDITTYVSKR